MSGKPRRLEEIFMRRVETAGNALHLILPDGQLMRYADTLADARRLAGAMANAGVSPGDCVACLMGNSRALYELYIACALLDVISVPINTMSATPEIARIFADCTPRALLVDRQFIEKIPVECANPLRIVTEGDEAGYHSYADVLMKATAYALPKPGERDPSRPRQ